VTAWWWWLANAAFQDTNFPDAETVQTTTATGTKFVQQLKRSTDKNGREISGAFLDLPDRDEYPDYYQQIAMPISLNMIDEKLGRYEYQNMEQLEGDLKRMVQNAKDYNDSRSEIFQDAERIRKALSNFMPKHNPAYLDPEYRAVPTPIPQALLDRVRQSSVSTNATGSERVKIVLKQRASMPASTDGEEDLQERMLLLLEDLSTQEHAV
jgi:Bromodomain